MINTLNRGFVYNTTKWLLFLNVFMTAAVFRIRDYADKSIDLQVMLKLGIWGISLIFCLFCYRLWVKKLFQIDNVLLIPLLMLIIASCFYSLDRAYSLASAFSLVAVLFMFFMASAVLTTQEFLQQIIRGCTTVVAASIAVYFIDPEFGRMKEWVNGVLTTSTRLSGITGAANACGYIAAMALLVLCYYRKLPTHTGIIYWLCIGINVAGLIMSDSRTSMAALIFSLLITSAITTSKARLAAFCLFICIALVSLATLDMDSVFQMLSRSGDIYEISTGTGRTAIWAVVVDLIHQRPLWGWGYASSNILIPEAAVDIGFTAGHAHNAFLQIILSVGYIGLALFAAILLIKIYFSFISRELVAFALISFLFIGGLTEPIAFYGPASTTTLALATLLALNYRHNHGSQTRYPSYK